LQLSRLFLAALAVASCVGVSAADLEWAQRGRDDAARDLAEGAPRLVWIGIEQPDTSPLDVETGLVRRSVACCRTSDRVAYGDAYNAVVREALDAGRLSGVLLAHKATTRDAVAAAFASQTPVELRTGRAPVASPDGRFLVEVGPAVTTLGEAIFVRESATNRRTELHWVEGPAVRVVFADGGTTLFVRDDAFGAYETFDLPQATLLQVFTDPGWDR
jgi:hypothetical protein